MAIPSLPAPTALLDSLYMTTWYKMQTKAIDNILTANVVSAALKAKGCFKGQNGGRLTERLVRYGTKTAVEIGKGDVLPTGEDEYGTAAQWTPRYIAATAQRSIITDAENAGEGRKVEWVQQQLQMMRDSLNTKMENVLLAGIDATTGGAELRAPKTPYSLWNIFPGDNVAITTDYESSASYTYGGIDKSNSWWGANYLLEVAPILSNLRSQWLTMFNTCSQGSGERPDLIITNQTHWETYHELCGSQVLTTSPLGKRMADWGYTTLNFLGAEVLLTFNSSWPTYGTMFLNTDYLEVVYNSGLWFWMKPWDWVDHRQLERSTACVCGITGVITPQLRRHGYIGKP